MCGIAGFVGKGTKETLWGMINAIRYRGPDHQDVALIENVGLAHARLSIIDIEERSNQPFFSTDKKYTLIFNGEIYNYQSIKQALEKTNKYTFTTQSDTEVLLYAYMEYGIDFLHIIQGMFVFALYDGVKKELIIAKDRMGKKPLYYTRQNGAFVFASELKALLQHPSVSKNINYDALNAYLTFDYVPTPLSIFDGIHKLEPSQYIIVNEKGIIKQNNYWKINFTQRDISLPDAASTLNTLLNDAVQCRMMSDVPLGVFLSGGIDSSTVAYYAQKNAVQKIKTFSIGFKEKSYDESNYAQLVARCLGTDHYEHTLSAQESLNLIPNITSKSDEPFADPSIIPTYLLSHFTRQHVTVALGGDGSDELLAGYPTFISEKLSYLFHLMPKSFIRFLRLCSNFLPVSDKNISLDFKIDQFLKGFEGTRTQTHSLWLGSFTPRLKNAALLPQIKAQLNSDHGLDRLDNLMPYAASFSHFNQVIYTYLRTYLLDDILVKVDRASMYHSLEVRAPFLDTAVIDFLNSLPQSYKMKGTNGKRILKTLMRGKIPDAVIDRPKKGFGIPVSSWIRNELKGLSLDLLDAEKIKKQQIFDPVFVQKLLQEHNAYKKNHRKPIWNLMIFQMWYRHFFE